MKNETIKECLNICFKVKSEPMYKAELREVIEHLKQEKEKNDLKREKAQNSRLKRRTLKNKSTRTWK